MNNIKMWKKFLYSLLYTGIYIIIQFLHGNMTEWYFYFLLFAFMFFLVNTKTWENIMFWAKKKDEQKNTNHLTL